MQYIFSSHPALKGEQPKDQQRQRSDPKIAQRGKCKRTQHRVRNQRHGQATHAFTPRSLAETARDFASGLPTSHPLSLTPAKRLNLVHREGFEPSYLARRDRFTVCWL